VQNATSSAAVATRSPSLLSRHHPKSLFCDVRVQTMINSGKVLCSSTVHPSNVKATCPSVIILVAMLICFRGQESAVLNSLWENSGFLSRMVSEERHVIFVFRLCSKSFTGTKAHLLEDYRTGPTPPEDSVK
jgi:hypothetical protein